MTQSPRDDRPAKIEMLEAEMEVDHNLRQRYEVFSEAGIVANMSEFLDEIRLDFWRNHPDLHFVDPEEHIPAEAWMQRGATW